MHHWWSFAEIVKVKTKNVSVEQFKVAKWVETDCYSRCHLLLLLSPKPVRFRMSRHKYFKTMFQLQQSREAVCKCKRISHCTTKTNFRKCCRTGRMDPCSLPVKWNHHSRHRTRKTAPNSKAELCFDFILSSGLCVSWPATLTSACRPQSKHWCLEPVPRCPGSHLLSVCPSHTRAWPANVACVHLE